MTQSLRPPWIVRLADSSHMLLAPAIFLTLSLGYYWIVTTYSRGDGCCWVSEANLWGTIATYSAIPTYVLLVSTYLWRETHRLLDDLKLADGVDVIAQVLQPPRLLLLAFCAVGAGVAITQYSSTLWNMHQLSNVWLDLSMVVSNLITWTLAAWLVAARLYAGIAMLAIGRRFNVNLYGLSDVRPFGRMAILNVLFVMGIIALIPLQSLDFEVRWVNYKDALTFLVPVAVAMALLPMLGIRRAILIEKDRKTQVLNQLISEADQADPIQMETLLAHRDRIEDQPTWPLDVSLLSRVALYVVLPPIAWSAAALVEVLIEQLLTAS